MCWEPVDGDTALLVVPFGGPRSDSFVARFDPETGLLYLLEALRYKNSADERKTLWISAAREWGVLDGDTTLAVAALTWLDEGSPWAVFTVEEVSYNVDVRISGPKDRSAARAGARGLNLA